jgi:aminodeoxyfutalosine deaminase
VVEAAQRCKSPRIVAFGIGGDELSIRSSEFRGVYLKVADCGLHRLIHAGEIGGPEKIREAVEFLGVERVGHGVAAIHDVALMDLLADRRIALEICPTSNLRTGALARQVGDDAAGLAQHPMAKLIRHGVPVVLSTDDPAMFHTTLSGEYQRAREMGLTEKELEEVVVQGFAYSFAGKEKRVGRVRERN